MKSIFICSSIILAVVSCNKLGVSGKNQIIQEDNSEFAMTTNILTDSLKLEDSLTINNKLSAVFSAKAILFPKIKNKSLLDSIYTKFGIQLDSYSKTTIAKELERQKKKYFDETSKDATLFTPDFKQTWYENNIMEVFSYNNGQLTLTYENDGFSGGAHGYYNILYKNFDLKKNKSIELEDIFNNISEMDWNIILTNHFDNDEQKDMLLVNKIPVNHNFYFNQRDITFVYNQYEITAYAAGVVEISVPFSEVRTYLKPEFIKRYGIK